MNLTPQQIEALKTWKNKGINAGWQCGDTIGQIATDYHRPSKAERAHIQADRELVKVAPALKGKAYAEVQSLC